VYDDTLHFFRMVDHEEDSSECRGAAAVDRCNFDLQLVQEAMNLSREHLAGYICDGLERSNRRS